MCSSSVRTTPAAARSRRRSSSYAPEDIRAESAGQAPAEAIWPNVIEAMREVGIDLATRRPKKIDPEMQLHADKAITLNCQDTCPFVIGGVEDWEVDDPAGQPLEKVREIRDEIERRVLALLERADEIRADRTAHERRLEQLLPRLVEEFGETKPAEEIRACADAILCEFDDAPVRTFVLTVAERRARDCLREPVCAALS